MKYIVMPALFAMFVITQSSAQDSTKSSVRDFLNAKHYTFIPTSITTGGGSTRQLTTEDFFLKISGDTLVSYLPYFGRAYSAPIDTKNAGYDFTTTSFNYAVSAGKKNSYKVVIKTTGKIYNADFLLTVYDNGTAYMQANSSDKQPVSYIGNVNLK